MVLVCASVSAAAADPDPLQIVIKALDLNRKAEAVVREYSMTQETIKREIGPDGKVRSTAAETFEVHPVAGEPLQKLIRRNGQPLPPDEARKAQAKFDQAVWERRNETPEQRRRRLAKFEQKLAQRRQIADELPAAFTFRLDGEETMDGHESWRIVATPRPGYQPKSARTAFLTKMEGRFWISKQHNRLVKLDAVTTGPVSIGWFLAKIAPGTRFVFEHMRLNEDVWVVRRFLMAYDARIALIKHARGETEQITWGFNRPVAPAANAGLH